MEMAVLIPRGSSHFRSMAANVKGMWARSFFNASIAGFEYRTQVGRIGNNEPTVACGERFLRGLIQNRCQSAWGTGLVVVEGTSSRVAADVSFGSCFRGHGWSSVTRAVRFALLLRSWLFPELFE